MIMFNTVFIIFFLYSLSMNFSNIHTCLGNYVFKAFYTIMFLEQM